MLQRGKRGIAKHVKKTSDDELTLHFQDLKDEDESSNAVKSPNFSYSERHNEPMIGATQEKQASQLLHKKDVTEHPLMPILHSSSEEDDVEMYQEKKKRPVPPPRPPKPKLPVNDPPQERVLSKNMISSVLFDQKARTQLFSSLKKGLQQYTHHNLSTGLSNDDTNTGKDSLTSSDILSRSETVNKGVRERALEPLNVVKKSPEDAVKKENSEVLRRRSSSENNILDIHSNSVTDEKSKQENSESHHFHETKKSRSPAATVMSLSTLLADRKETINEPVPIQKNREVGEVVKQPHKVRSAISTAVTMEITNILHPVTRRANAKNFQETPVSPISIYLLAIPVFLFCILPLPSSLQLATATFFIGGISATSILCLIVSPKKQIQSFKPPYITQTVPYEIPKMNFNIHETYKGWMNEIDEYDTETYHIAATTSVFITLEGSTLRLQTPRRNISKRAIHGEKTIQPTDVIQSRVFGLQDAKVYLIPHDLVKKRVWSKKYPICIEILEPRPDTDLPGEVRSEQEIDEERICKEKIYLFGRTLPEKERWFYRFQRAITICEQEGVRERSASIEKSLEELDEEFEIIDDQNDVAVDPVKVHRNYYVYMCRLLPDPNIYAKDTPTKAPSKPVIDYDQQMIQFSSLPDEDVMQEVITTQPGSKNKSSGSTEPTLDVAWFNVVIGRVMFDFFRLQKWADWVATKLQKKLEKIRLPYFMEGLKLTAIDLGRTMPLIHKISLPRMDAQGIWFDMDITFNGSVQMTLETKLVLTRLGKKEENPPSVETRASAAVNSDEEDSAESSDDDESIITQALPSYVQHLVPKGSENSPPPKHKGSAKDNSSTKKSSQGTPAQEKKWMRFVDSVTKSKYFQKVAETAYVKRKLETVSNTPLILTAELNHCNGTLSINIPPPPSDRIWYGFKEPPEMSIKAKPKFGERAVTVTPITDWIEKKLGQEFNAYKHNREFLEQVRIQAVTDYTLATEAEIGSPNVPASRDEYPLQRWFYNGISDGEAVG